MRQPGRRRDALGPTEWAVLATTNCTALGIIGATTVISWSLSIVVCVLYLFLLMAVAVYLEMRSQVYRQAVNLLWVLACAALLALGTMAGTPKPVGVFAIKENSSADSTAQATPWPTPAPTPLPLPPLSNDLTQVLPPDSVEELQAWARDDSQEAAQRPSFRAFQGSVWFSAMDAETNETVLWHVKADGGSRPFSEIVSPHSFVLFRERLYFSARRRGAGESLWFVRKTDEPEVAARTVFESAMYTAVKQLFVVGEGSGELLYLKVEYACANSGESVASILRFSAVSESVTDMRPGVCATRHARSPAEQPATIDVASPAVPNAGQAAEGDGGGNAICNMSWHGVSTCCGSDRERRAWHARLWGALLVADLPAMGLATVGLALRRMPGLFINLFAGVWVAVTAALILAWDLDHGGFVALQREFLLLYTTLLWVGILVLTILVPRPPTWLEELRQWAIKCTAPTFLGAMHLKLDIPATNIYWHWVVYALLIVAHVPVAAVVRDPLLVLLSMIGLFVLAWKNSHLLMDITCTQHSPTAELVLMACSMLLQGAGIIAGGVACLSNFQQGQNIVAQVLQGCKLNWLQASDEDEYYED